MFIFRLSLRVDYRWNDLIIPIFVGCSFFLSCLSFFLREGFSTSLRVIWSFVCLFKDSAADLAPRFPGAFFSSLHCSLGTPALTA